MADDLQAFHLPYWAFSNKNKINENRMEHWLDMGSPTKINKSNHFPRGSI